jgi:hypothetical protein
MIAPAGGAAAAIAIVSPKIGPAIVGGAISVAATGKLSVGGRLCGGLQCYGPRRYPMIVIQFAFSVVLWLRGFRNVRHFGTWSFLEFLRSNFGISPPCAHLLLRWAFVAITS